ncbi:4a-hydroxytetrahydrobiopterin dehydratase [Arthrobacter stackebrandtii]|uniref:Putative pterin-4-alpha-carbinolamine dehydratase n=1 Tax=Arthrobacter stackebrandtii TaxID=272161 RepID=A0ABS4YXT2_9MICC|nr:4a-hydroxytetrahydrobiopterin dehydratase [Arthrobacter stackebrandtii]MBP2413597.1 4a-hydroxytetrahydrobiopterin dehydratase [Arthrobacter stackebrandtii]PYH00581.1 4a-hydroxytetrahydrobiopterin dehydratase [Arthrobacter stackebrandtii]
MGAQDTLTRPEIDAALVELPGWRLRLGGLSAALKCPTSATALDLFATIGALAQAANHHPDVDWRYDTLFVVLSSHDAGNKVTARDVALARAISSAAAEAGAVARPELLRAVEIAMDTADFTAVAPVWAAALGLKAGEPDELRDPAGRLPTMWFQQTETPNANRFHFDIHVPASEAQRVLAEVEAAGATLDRSSAPQFVIATDVQGNRLCICTEEGRDA